LNQRPLLLSPRSIEQDSFATSTISLIEIAGGRRFTTSASSTSGAFGDFNGVHKGDRTSPKSVQLKKANTFQELVILPALPSSQRPSRLSKRNGP
jgi:hypothetical protein